jgi:hypothetical protein
MLNLRRKSWLALAGSALALASLGSQAAPQTFFGAQGPKANLNSPLPPAIAAGSDIAVARTGFGALVDTLGEAEFETAAPSTAFSYTGGTASILSGDPAWKDGNVGSTNLQLGRYNMTGDLPNNGNGDPDFGRFIESASSFVYSFSRDLSAFSFYGTDFGDFFGTFRLELFNDGKEVFGQALSNQEAQGAEGNGNLLYFGVVLDQQVFDEIRFVITQTSPTAVDVLGFDSFTVGTRKVTVPPNPAPEPSSIALVGLSLLGLGAASRRKSQG